MTEQFFFTVQNMIFCLGWDTLRCFSQDHPSRTSVHTCLPQVAGKYTKQLLTDHFKAFQVFFPCFSCHVRYYTFLAAF